jgi:hypothetical protein|tara:strand:+ start:27 stop:1898 length:1872 start_codon:yes stop_codon:yes gene_type:complete
MNLVYLLILLIILYILQQKNKITERFKSELKNEQILKLKIVERKEPIIKIYKNKKINEKQIIKSKDQNLLNVNGIFIENIDDIENIENKEQSLYYTDVHTYIKKYKNYKALSICNVPKQILLISKNEISIVNDKETTNIGYINKYDMELFKILLKSQKNYINMNNYEFIEVTKETIINELFEEEKIDIFIYFDTLLNPLYNKILKQDLYLVPYDYRIKSNSRDLSGMSLNNNILKFYLPYSRKKIQTITLNNDEGPSSDNMNIIYNTILIDCLIFSFNNDEITKYNKIYLYLLNYLNEFVKINYYIQHLDFLKISKEWSIRKQENARFKNVMENFNEQKGYSLKFKINDKNIIAHKKELNKLSIENIVIFKINKKIINGVPIKKGDKLYTRSGLGNFEKIKFYYVINIDEKYVYVKDTLYIVISQNIYNTREISEGFDRILLNKNLITKYKLEENDKVYFNINKNLIIGKVAKDNLNLIINIDKKDPNNKYLPQFRCYQDETILTKTECEGNVDKIGKDKTIYNWDRPCKTNTECPFYLKNKNYTNERGGCNNGYCELPIGVKRLSYRNYDKNITEGNYPHCHGCNINDGIDCCEKQEKNKKMNGANYAFKNDNEDRRLSKFF